MSPSPPSPIRSVAVFCGSRFGALPAYRDAAEALGAGLAAGGFRLVYGGGRVGLMGVVADAALAAGGMVLGVIPEALSAKEIAHDGLTELIVVPGMHERKALMAERARGFLDGVALAQGLDIADDVDEEPRVEDVTA